MGALQTNGSAMGFAGQIHGDVATNGGNVTATARIAGSVRNDFYQPLPEISTPQWTSFTTVNSGSEVELAGGPVGSPRRYRLNDLSGALIIPGGTTPTAVEIWVTGDMVGAIRLGPNVQAKIYVGGNVTLRDTTITTSGNSGNGVGAGTGNNNNTVTYNAVDNQTRRAANLQIYGLKPPEGQTRTMQMPLGRDLHAAVYAPSHDVTLSGTSSTTGHVMGSFAVKSMTTAGAAKFHFDQALASSSVPVIDYKVASWIEDTEFKLAQ
jgi:hypothetical protein